MTKPLMTTEEYQEAQVLLARGHGYGYIAHEISLKRGAHTLDPATNRRRAVSKSWVARALRDRAKMAFVPKPDSRTETHVACQNGFEVEVRGTEHQVQATSGTEPDRTLTVLGLDSETDARKKTPDDSIAGLEEEAEPTQRDVDESGQGAKA